MLRESKRTSSGLRANGPCSRRDRRLPSKTHRMNGPPLPFRGLACAISLNSYFRDLRKAEQWFLGSLICTKIRLLHGHSAGKGKLKSGWAEQATPEKMVLRSSVQQTRWNPFGRNCSKLEWRMP